MCSRVQKNDAHSHLIQKLNPPRYGHAQGGFNASKVLSITFRDHIGWKIFISDSGRSDDISGIWANIGFLYHSDRPSKMIYRKIYRSLRPIFRTINALRSKKMILAPTWQWSLITKYSVTELWLFPPNHKELKLQNKLINASTLGHLINLLKIKEYEWICTLIPLYKIKIILQGKSQIVID